MARAMSPATTPITIMVMIPTVPFLLAAAPMSPPRASEGRR
jgi:hypothetical protein